MNIIINTEMRQVVIDGRNYVPESDLFRLTLEHIRQAFLLSAPQKALEWAMDNTASADEMTACVKAGLIEDAPAAPKPKKPVAVADTAKATRNLF